MVRARRGVERRRSTGRPQTTSGRRPGTLGSGIPGTGRHEHVGGRRGSVKGEGGGGKVQVPGVTAGTHRRPRDLSRHGRPRHRRDSETATQPDGGVAWAGVGGANRVT